MHRLALSLVVIFAATGCHTFQPTAIDEVAPGQAIRARVTGAYSDTLSAVLQRTDAREVEGRVVERIGTSMLLEVPVSRSLEGMRFQTLNQRIEIPDGAIQVVETKELDRLRTFGAAGIGAAIVIAIVVNQLSGETGGGDIPGPGSPSDGVVSADLFRVPVTALGWLVGR